MMDWYELGDWITSGLMVGITTLLLLVAVCVLVVAVCQAIYVLWRILRGGAKTPALSIEEVLERIPDVPYQELPGGAGGGAAADEDGRETCVICAAPYDDEPGEACGVLPACGHVFHKLCVAKWLRQNSTCPLCRADFAVTDDARQTNDVTTVENMV